MSTTKKALDIAAELLAELKVRLPALAASQTLDTDSNPVIQFGAATAGSAGFLIKVRPISWPLSQDVLGNASTIFTPHVCQLATEANFAGTTDNVADVNTPAIVLTMISALAARGTKVEWYNSASGTAPTTATLTSGNLKGTWDNLYYPMVSSQ